jgi:DNA-binding IclR family transcriptional regulator
MVATLDSPQARRPSRGSAGVSAVLDVLDALDRRGPATLSELARETGVAKSTLHRVCSKMGERGWIARDLRSGQIGLGPRIAWLARATPESALAGAFHTVAAWLVERHNEATCLTVRDGLVAAVGHRLPAFACASGRVMLADLSDDEVAALYAGHDLETPTGRRLDGLEELLAILHETRRRGWGENLDETALGLHCIAAPLGPRGRVSAAITMCIPSGRMSPARKREMLPDLLAAARELVPGSDSQRQRKVGI